MKLHALGVTYVKNEKLYIPSWDFNALFCVDMQNWSVEYLTFFEKYAKSQIMLFRKGIAEENKIYFMPYYADHIVIYYLDDHRKEYIGIGNSPDIVISSFIVGKYAWLFMMSYPNRIVRVDMESYEMEEQYLGWNNIFASTGMKEDGLTAKVRKYTILSVQQSEGQFWIVLYNLPGILLTYDINTNKTQVHKITGMENDVFSSIVVMQECIWINVTNRKKLVRWEENTQKLDSIYYEAVDADEVWSVMASIDKYIIIARANELISYNTADGTCKTMYYSEKAEFRSYERIENSILFYPYEGDILILFDACRNEINEHRLKWEQKLNTQLIDQWYDGYIDGEGGCSLDEFLDAVSVRGKRKVDGIKPDSIGYTVWKDVSQ